MYFSFQIHKLHVYSLLPVYFEFGIYRMKYKESHFISLMKVRGVNRKNKGDIDNKFHC